VLGLIGDALIIFITNILIFAMVLVHRFGQHAFLQSHRSIRVGFSIPAAPGCLAWLCRLDPHFFDYIFLAYNTSVAFSPTETAPLSRAAKI
jgi:hypothetical protein